jgi:hypothetical protein
MRRSSRELPPDVVGTAERFRTHPELRHERSKLRSRTGTIPNTAHWGTLFVGYQMTRNRD